MLARAGSHILLVQGAIPGEIAEVAVERVHRNTAWARTLRVEAPSEDRVDPPHDLACGGMLYAHVRYERQLVLKADVLRDACARIGRLPLDGPINVVPSRTEGYRIRARLHVRGGQLGFFREGTHEVCDARRTRQLSSGAVEALAALHDAVRADGSVQVDAIEIAETIDASARVCHIVLSGESRPSRLSHLQRTAGLAGVSCGHESAGARVLWGEPRVTDALEIDGAAGAGGRIRLQRHVRAFFQSNRFLVTRLAARVAELVPAGQAIDLYAGVGLFAVTLAARADTTVTAVERDDIAAIDLERNALPYRGQLQVRHMAVEELAAGGVGGRPRTVILDPPRTGLSQGALRVVVECRGDRIVYVSCDAPTLARDARLLVGAGYGLTSIELFDLFPNTPHVESLAVFDRHA